MTTERMPVGQFPGFLGIESVAIDDDKVVAELPIRGEHFAPNGFVHAAVLVGLADTLCGYGCLASLPEDATGFTTVELKTNFLGAAREGTLTATAVPVHRGRSTQLWDATVTAADGRTVAVFRCTQLVLWPRG